MEYTFKKFEDLVYSDDWMFKKVMENKDICQKVIERLLHIQVADISYPELEKAISPYYTSHGVRLDVYVKDSDRVFDLEIQSYKEDALGKRMRYYQSMVDIDSLMKGEDYTKLKESYIIFICTKDSLDDSKSSEKIFDIGECSAVGGCDVNAEAVAGAVSDAGGAMLAGRSVYTFRTTCQEDSRIKLNDKSVKVIYNANAYENESDPDTKSFLKFVCKNTAGDNLSTEIANRIAEIKRIESNKTEYMSMNLHESDLIRHAKADGFAEGELRGKEIGLAEGTLRGEIAGAQKKAIEAAKNFLDMGLSYEQVSKGTGLSIEEVETLSGRNL